jgi:hypothetical protein
VTLEDDGKCYACDIHLYDTTQGSLQVYLRHSEAFLSVYCKWELYDCFCLL